MGTKVAMASRGGRALLLVDERAIDVETRSEGRFGPSPLRLLEDWDAFCAWARSQTPRSDDARVDPADLGPCVPNPGQILAIGLNYRDHAEEAGLPIPTEPMVFTKFASCLAGPAAAVPLTSDRVDWEVELVVVIGRGGRRISESEALSHVAGYCVGQDVSDRRRQFGDTPPQFSLGKSCEAFGPIGPAVVPLDELRARGLDPLDLALHCDVDGERMQQSRTSQMIFSVPELIAYLSRYCDLRPGDLVFTGTPSGVGSVRTPRRYLAPGETVSSEIEGLGRLLNRFWAGED